MWDPPNPRNKSGRMQPQVGVRPTTRTNVTQCTNNLLLGQDQNGTPQKYLVSAKKRTQVWHTLTLTWDPPKTRTQSGRMQSQVGVRPTNNSKCNAMHAQFAAWRREQTNCNTTQHLPSSPPRKEDRFIVAHTKKSAG